jgi:hypothetical protein
MLVVSVTVLCVNVIVTTYTLVTFHAESVRIALHVIMGPASSHSHATTFFGELRSTTISRKATPLLLVFKFSI